MGYKFNPFTGNLDDVGSGGGGGATSPGGSTTQVQFNDGGAFGGDADLTWDKTTNVLTAKGDINLDAGAAGFVTTLQTITPTANRTISLPDATGTVALVGGSSGQLLYNNAGANAGASTLTYDGSILTTSGRFINSYNATASSPAKAFTGTWFTGGTATTTKPHVLVEPTGTTSTAWSTSGTGFGVNAASGFAGNLLDLQVNGTSRFKADASTGRLWAGTGYVRGVGGVAQLGNSTGGEIEIGGGGDLRLAAGAPITWNFDTSLQRDGAADTLAQRRGTNAQVFRVYNTYTSSTNYELGKLEWNSNAFRIGTEKGSGGGTARNLELQTDGTTRATLDTSGRLLVGTSTAVAAGAKLQTVDGITFPAAQVASADPNTLDDYEEGTFTPTVSGATTAGTGTYSIQVGRYTKVGNRVQFTVYMVWTGHTGTGAMRVSGLPFTSSTVANTLHAISIWQQNITLTAGTLMMGYVLNSNTQVGLSEIATGGGTQAPVAMDPSGDIIVTGVYEV